MGQKCEWSRLEMGSGGHLIRYFYEKKQIIILPPVCNAQAPQPTEPVLFSGGYWLPRIKAGAWNFIQEPELRVLQHLGSCSGAPCHMDRRVTGGSLLMVNVNFLCGSEDWGG